MNQAQIPSDDVKQPALPTFDALQLGSDVRKAVDALGYLNPTPVQLAVFEPATRGKNLVVQARTGTGKTAAFGLPIVDALVKKSQPGVQALILTPTRELALQVGSELEQLAKFRGTKIVPIYGGAPMGKQVTALAEGAQIVTGTPGRVLDHIRRGTLDTSHIRIFVLDEADEMLSMGFAKELNAIISELPKDRQGLYFSATIPPDVERLANNHLREPEYITLSSDQVGALEINHYVYLVREGAKRDALARIIEVENPESAIVFCNTKDETERVAEMLKQRGYDAEWLNGDLEQREREKVMSATREGKVRFLVCTDVAARGIDISHLTHVINADFPESAEQYVHRTGRTGRAGRTGTAISVVGPKDVGHLYMLRLTYKIRPIERTLPTAGELKTRAEADVVAFLADAYLGKKPDPMHLAVARRLFTHENAEQIVAGLLADHLGATTTEDAAEARRAKNPPPVPSEEPRTLRGGERAEKRPEERRPEERRSEVREGRDRPREMHREGARAPSTDGGRERGRDERQPRERDRDRDRDRSAERAAPQASRHGHRGQPQAALAEWEPPVADDDDAPLFPESSTKPGLGPSEPATQRRGPAQAQGQAQGQPRGDRGRDRDRGGRRWDRPRHREDDFESNRNPRMPGITIEDAPTVIVSGEDANVPSSRTREPREAERVQEGFANIFLNVGRRDGLRPADIQRMLIDRAGIAEAEVGHIRIRDRISFVGVKNEQADRVIAALVGHTVGDRTINAERARERA